MRQAGALFEIAQGLRLIGQADRQDRSQGEAQSNGETAENQCMSDAWQKFEEPRKGCKNEQADDAERREKGRPQPLPKKSQLGGENFARKCVHHDAIAIIRAKR